MLLRSIIRSGLKGIPVNNQPPSDIGIQTQASKYPGLPRDVGITTLGDYRMNSAIYEGMSVPPIQIKEDRPVNTVSFATDGNLVAQPSTEVGTASLIKRLGDQKTKYARNEPYAKYLAYNKLERELKDAEKGASPNEAGILREILRDAVEKRRTQNEQDFLRKMLDSGVSMEDAKDEVENVRRANNLKEANMVDDRIYQSKMALKAFANKRGINSSVLEPLSHSGAIMNPQTSELLANAAGTPERAFGNSPLDIDRLAQTPAFYKRFLRKSNLTQEQADRDAAIGEIIKSGVSNVKSLSEVPSLERSVNIENMRENVAATLDNLKNRPEKNLAILPPTLFGGSVVDDINKSLGKSKGDSIRTQITSFEKLNPSQLVFAINYLVSKFSSSNVYILKNLLKTSLNKYSLYPNVLKNTLTSIATQLTPEKTASARLPVLNNINIPIPYNKILEIVVSFGKADSKLLVNNVDDYLETVFDKEALTSPNPTPLEKAIVATKRATTRRNITGAKKPGEPVPSEPSNEPIAPPTNLDRYKSPEQLRIEKAIKNMIKIKNQRSFPALVENIVKDKRKSNLEAVAKAELDRKALIEDKIKALKSLKKDKLKELAESFNLDKKGNMDALITRITEYYRK